MAGQTRYEQELRRQLRTREFVPELAAPDFLRRLDRVAHRALLGRTVEGNLAAILIYHQLVEEMLRLLLLDCEVYLQLAAFPAEIRFPTRRKQLFGRLHQALAEYTSRTRSAASPARPASTRIGIVHGLVQPKSSAGLRSRVLRAQRLYAAIYALFDEAHDFFRLCFKDFRKDTFEIF